ncbi:MAG: cation:proton antiporter [Candidatus Bathyarchaeota archaeon]
MSVLWIILSLMFFASYLLHLVFNRLRIPGLLAPFIVGLLFQGFLPLTPLPSSDYSEIIPIFSDLGIIFLLFLIGVNIESHQLLGLSKSIIALAALNLGLSSILGGLFLIRLGYPPLIALIVATALATVAEATIAPILDEMKLLKTTTANLIIGSGILDDVAEVLLASLASFITGTGTSEMNPVFLGLGLLFFVGLALVAQRGLMPILLRFEPRCNEEQIFLLALFVALLFVGVSLFFGFGVLLGAIVGGWVFQRYLRGNDSRKTIVGILRPVAYGFLGPIFFFSIGFGIGFISLVESFEIMIVLFLINVVAKFASAYIVGNRIGLNRKAIVVIGLGLSAKFSMGIIPVQILYASGIIDKELFSAFVAVSAVSTATIPFLLAGLMSRWRRDIP